MVKTRTVVMPARRHTSRTVIASNPFSFDSVTAAFKMASRVRSACAQRFAR